MFSLLKGFGIQLTIKREGIPFLVAFVIAELFFKFKSFALECLAFLAVWFVLSYLQSLLLPHRKEHSAADKRGLERT